MPREDHDSQMRDVWRYLITRSYSYQAFVVYIGQLVRTIDYWKLFVTLRIYETCNNFLCHQCC